VWFTVVVISAIGAFLYLDRVAWGRWMISRPIVIGPFLGYLYGELQAGLLIGVVLEAIWLNRLPVGSTIPPDDSFMAILATGSLIVSNRYLDIQGTDRIALVVFLALPGTLVGGLLDGIVRRWNVRLSNFQMEAIDKGQLSIAGSVNLLGIINFFLVFFIGFVVFIFLEVFLIQTIQPWLNESFLNVLNGVFRCLPLLAVASVLTLNRGRRSWAFWLAGYSLVSLFLWLIQ